MALPQSALSELLEAFRTGDGVDLIRDSVRVALQEGYTELHIGPNTAAEIRSGDLALSSEEIRRKHRERAVSLIRHLAGAKGLAELEKENTKTLRDWVAWWKG